MKAEIFFTQLERDRIQSVVQQVEKKTSGEIAVMVVNESDTYPEAGILGGIIPAGVFALGITEYFLDGSQWYFTAITLFLSFIFYWLIDYFPMLKRIFINKTRSENQVQEQAVQSFFQKGLYHTKNNTGVLFFISLLEHKVWILADKGIYKKIEQETLQSYADDIATGIKKGNACEALICNIKKIGEILAKHFPIQTDDTNELTDSVIFE